MVKEEDIVDENEDPEPAIDAVNGIIPVYQKTQVIANTTCIQALLFLRSPDSLKL